ncbi:MAG: hypothetical protein R3C49_06740 [Planctomycetaceae bacterium]
MTTNPPSSSRSDRRVVLVVRCFGVDLEFAAHRYAGCVEALSKDAVSTPIVAKRTPGDQVAAIKQ